MKLSTGKVAFPIEFDNGDKQNIYFNPNDPNLFIRLKDFETKTKERLESCGDFNLKNDGYPEAEEQIEQFRKVQNIIFEELDIAFNGEVSSVVFKHCSPFAIINGEFFIMQFIDAITPEIEKHIKKANGEVSANLEKHIAKYKK